MNNIQYEQWLQPCPSQLYVLFIKEYEKTR